MGRISHIAAALTAILISGACQKATDIPESEGRLIEVPLSLCVMDMEHNVDTKATEPYIPDYENLIYDIWVLQYSSRGVLLSSTVNRYRASEAGVTKVNDLKVTLRESVEDCTVCLLVNLGEDPLLGAAWPDNLDTYRRTMIPIGMMSNGQADNGLKMPMNGFYKGPVPPRSSSATGSLNGGDYSGSLNVSLGRMLCRINVVLNNALVTEGYTTITGLDVEIENVPDKSHLLPTINYVMPDKSIMGRLEDSVQLTLEKGESTVLYYYMAPNLYSYEEGGTDSRTKLNISAMIQGIGVRSGTVILGNDPPSMDARDYRLYPNNQYTFTINLRNDH